MPLVPIFLEVSIVPLIYTFVSTRLHILKLCSTKLLTRSRHRPARTTENHEIDNDMKDYFYSFPCLQALNSLPSFASRLLGHIATSALYPFPLRKAFIIMQSPPILTSILRMLCWSEMSRRKWQR